MKGTLVLVDFRTKPEMLLGKTITKETRTVVITIEKILTFLKAQTKKYHGSITQHNDHNVTN